MVLLSLGAVRMRHMKKHKFYKKEGFYIKQMKFYCKKMNFIEKDEFYAKQIKFY